jgi:hypothetical protein
VPVILSYFIDEILNTVSVGSSNPMKLSPEFSQALLGRITLYIRFTQKHLML